MEARRILILPMVAALLLMISGQALAYDDSIGAHSKINELAIAKFQSDIMPKDPYLINATLNGAKCSGIAWDPADGSRLNPPVIAISREKLIKRWIIDGGWSADEPEGTMAMVHFYDPLAPAGKRYLTDQQFAIIAVSSLNSEYANPEIDAVRWAFHKESWGTAFEQIYSWENGKEYLASALSSPDPGNVNYGNAWRSLGETMHLMADMTVPPHVRNDGHAKAFSDADPYESSTTYQLVESNAGRDPASAINYDQDPEKLMISVANFTNTNFLSKDTIPLPPGITSPWHKYVLPSVDGLTPDKNGYLHRTINGVDYRFAGPRAFLSRWFGTGKQLYAVDKAVCDEQRAVLIPTAIKSNAMLVSKFLPRFAVTAEVDETDSDNRYTMIGGIKGVYSSEWPDASSMKVRNGASILVTSGKTGKVTRTQVSLLDKSKDFNEFSYDFTAEPGDIVKLEFDLGGYTLASGEFNIEEEEDKEVEIVERIPVRNPQTVTVPQAPAKLEYDNYKFSNGKPMQVDSWYRENNKQVYHGPYKKYYENGNIEQDYTYAFGHKIGYARTYTSDSKLLEESFYGDDGVKQYEDRYSWAPGGQTGKTDFWSDGKTKKDTFIYDEKRDLWSYIEFDSGGEMTFEENYDNGKLLSRIYYENGKQKKLETFKDGKLVNTLNYKQ